jgi:hypothetical protein
MQQHGQEVANQGNSYNFFTENREKSVIDVTLGSSDVINLIQNWHVSKVNTFIAPRLIRAKLKTVAPEIVSRFIYNDSDWNKLQTHITTDLKSAKWTKIILWTINRIEEEAKMITKLIQEAMEICIPKKDVKVGTPVGWWNQALKDKSVEVDKAYKKFNKHTYNRRRVENA